MTHDDLVRMVLNSLTPEQRVEVLTSSRWDRHEFRDMVINHAIDLVEGEMFAETVKKERTAALISYVPTLRGSSRESWLASS